MGSLSDATCGKKLYLDTNVFIYALEGVEPWATPLRELFASIDSGLCTAVTSELTLAECLVRPFALGREDVVQVYRAALQLRPTLHITPVHSEILIAAARLRATTGLKLPDAIHAATALAQGCTVLLSNDTDLRRVAGIELIPPSAWQTA